MCSLSVANIEWIELWDQSKYSRQEPQKYGSITIEKHHKSIEVDKIQNELAEKEGHDYKMVITRFGY